MTDSSSEVFAQKLHTGLNANCLYSTVGIFILSEFSTRWKPS